MEKFTTTENNALKVLILEDSLPDLEFMVEQLSEVGYQLEVTHAENEAQFIEALEKNSYDIVLSDFSLPAFDAFGALEICQKVCPEVPFICVSGSIGEELAIDLLKKGAVDYVLKDRPERLPFSIKNALSEASEKAVRTKTARELQESENRFKQVAETANEWIWEMDTNGMYTYSSPVIELLMGYTPEEVVGKKYFYDFFIPEKREELKFAAFEVLATRENFNDFENSLQHKNGQILIVSTNGSPVFDDNGNFKGYRGVDEDITKRRQAEKNIIQNQFYLTKAQEIGSIGTWEIDLIKNELFWTEQNYINFGVPLGTPLTYETFLECIHPDDKEYVNAEWMAAINGKPYDIEHRLIVGGEVRWVREKADVEYDDRKKAIKAIGFSQDITNRKKAEEKLRDSEYRYRKIYEDGANGMIMTGNDLKFLKANRTFCQMVGYQEEELQQLTFTDITHPDDSAKDIANFKKMMARQIDVYTTEKRYLNKRGETVWVQLTVSPIYDSNGKFLYNIGIIVNVTDRKNAEEILKESYTLIKIAGEKAKLGGWSVNIGENRVYWSAEVASIHEKPSEYSPSVEEGINFYAPEWRSKIKKTFANCVGKGISFDEEMQIITAGGKRVWVRTIGEAVKDSNGKIVKVQGAFQDITERKIAEEELKKSQLLLKASLESQKNTILFSMDTEYRYLFFNKAHSDGVKAAYNKDLQIGTNSLEYITSDAVRIETKSYFDLALRGISNSNIQQYGDVNPSWFEAFYNPLYNEQQEIIGATCLGMNITERKQAEEKLKTSDRIFKHSLDMLCIAGFDGYFKVLNPAWTTILGWSDEELLTKPWIDFVHPDDRDNTKDIKAVIVDGKEVYQFENRYISKNGAIKWLSWNSFPYPQENIMFGVARDITERKKVEEALLAKMDELERFHKLTVGREIAMVGLKKEVNNLLNKLGQDHKYKIVE